MQRMCVGWFRLQYPAVGKLLFAVPNGGARSRTEAAIMKAEGVTAGVTDLIRFVEATPEEGIRMMLDQLRGQVDRITASADRYKLKEQKKEYLTRAGAQLKHTQIAELEFLLQ